MSLATGIPTASAPLAPQVDRRALLRFHARRRWARAAWLYLILIAFGTLFLGTFVVAFTASLKDDPLEQPFRWALPQLNPVNWAAAWAIADEAGGNPMLGGFAPGGRFAFEVTFAAPEGTEIVAPQVAVPRWQPVSAMGGVSAKPFAADHVRVTDPTEVARGTVETDEGTLGTATYRFEIAYEGQGPFLPETPLNVEMPRTQRLLDATLPPNRIERRGRVASWENVTYGAVGFALRNYVRAIDEARSAGTGESLFLTWVWNSFLLAIGGVAYTVLLATTAGYALARLHFPGKTTLFFVILFSMMLPAQVTFISNYLVLRDLSLLNTLPGVLLVVLVSAQVFMMKQFFENLPRELEEAAYVDGASPLTIFLRIVLPLAKPALLAITIMAFQGMWNQFFWALVVLISPQESFTLPIGLLAFRNAYGGQGDWGLILAGAFLSMIPLVILFIVFQRHFVEGVATTGLKE